MNLLPPGKLAAVEKCFAEHRGIRETERLTGVHRDTVSRYFRLFSDPNPLASGDGGGSQNFEVVEHDHDWHVFCWHDDTPEWWRHLATFHSERRARDYREECVNWNDLVMGDAKEAAEVDHPLPDENSAPPDLPAPPPVPLPSEEESAPPFVPGIASAIAAVLVSKEERQKERERRWDEEVAELPERRCASCNTILARRPGEDSGRFSKRKNCSPECAEKSRDRARENRRGANGEEEVATIIASVAQPAPREETPPGYKACPDCVWSGPLVDYLDHRRDDHGAD